MLIKKHDVDSATNPDGPAASARFPDSLEIAVHRAGSNGSSTDPYVVGPKVLDAGSHDGPLAGKFFAVKDLYDVNGTRTGVGNPDWLRDAPVANKHAKSVEVLCNAGACLVGKTTTDELAFSLSGTNVHYGTPPNPAAPSCVPGGSSSGSASAVAARLIDFALGTDTAGSTRVPASYCGIYGFRSTHGRISSEGVYLLAPSFCTFGLFARDPRVLEEVWRALRDSPAERPSQWIPRVPRALVVVPELFELVDEGARDTLENAVNQVRDQWGIDLEDRSLASLGDVHDILSIFRTIQLYEAWQLHGEWVHAHPHSLGPGVASRFGMASLVEESIVRCAYEKRAAYQERFRDFFGDNGYLVQPSACGPAPRIDLQGSAKDDLRLRTMALTSLAGLAGSPVVSLPLAACENLPVGLSVVGRPGDDDQILALASSLS